jgi:hypothetical protein
MAADDKLVFAVLHLGKNGMEVVASRSGRRRKVNVTWHRKEASDLPPADWDDQVFKELDFQDSDRMPDFG